MLIYDGRVKKFMLPDKLCEATRRPVCIYCLKLLYYGMVDCNQYYYGCENKFKDKNEKIKY